MRTRDLSPALIGKRVHIQGDNLDVTGVLTDLGVTTHLSADLTLPTPTDTPATLTSVIATLSDNQLRLTGDEACSVVGKAPTARSTA